MWHVAFLICQKVVGVRNLLWGNEQVERGLAKGEYATEMPASQKYAHATYKIWVAST